MSIVLNEKEWILEKFRACELGDHPLETLGRAAKYYRQVDGYSKKEAMAMLERFLVQCDPKVNLVSWSHALERVVKNADKRMLIEIDGIYITEKELETVGALGSMAMQRLGFTLLCLAKYWNAISSTNECWVNTPDKDIMQMANIRTSIKRQCDMFHELRGVGFVQFSKRVDNLNVRVLAISDDAPALYVSDFRSLGNQYMMFRGELYFHCLECGEVVRRNSTRQKYCHTCSCEIRTRQSIESVRRRRKALALARKNAEIEVV